MARSSSKYKKEPTGPSEQKLIGQHMYQEDERVRREHAQHVAQAPSPPPGRKGLTTYEIALYRRAYAQIGNGEAHGAKHLAQVKKHMAHNLKRGSYAFKVYNKKTGKEVK